MKPNKEAAKKKLKERMGQVLKGGIMEGGPLPPYARLDERSATPDYTPTKADGIEAVHREKRWQEYERKTKSKRPKVKAN